MRLKIRKKKVVLWIVGLLGAAMVAGIVMLVIFPGIFFWVTMGPVTYSWRYEPDLKSLREEFNHWVDVDVLAYFPVTIPAGASQVRFHYSTPPGDLDFQLRCVLPAEDVAALEARVLPAAKSVSHGSEEMYGLDPKLNESYIAGLFVQGDGSGLGKLPKEFSIYVMGTGKAMGAEKGKNRNGTWWDYDFGVAINRQNNEVIYWLFGAATGP